MILLDESLAKKWKGGIVRIVACKEGHTHVIPDAQIKEDDKVVLQQGVQVALDSITYQKMFPSDKVKMSKGG